MYELEPLGVGAGAILELSDVQEQYCGGQLGLIWLQFLLHQESV